jgi:hypothetical protein
MNLDHDTGAMDGQVLAGAFEGRALSSLSLPELLALLKECVAANDQSEALLMAYLDRVHEGWREQAGTAGGSAGGATGGMSEAEALDVLGLEQGASEAAIRKAYRDLMKKHHPDQGRLCVVCRTHKRSPQRAARRLRAQSRKARREGRAWCEALPYLQALISWWVPAGSSRRRRASAGGRHCGPAFC